MPHVRHALLVAIGALAASSLSCRSDEPMGAPNDLLAAAQAGRGQPCRGAGSCRLAFTVQPGTTPAGVTIAPAVEVTVQDPLGNTVTAFTGNVRVAIGTNPSGGHLSGTKSVGAVEGVARFTDLSIDRPGTGYSLEATSGSITAAQSAAFAITGPATHLAFTVQPTNTPAGVTIVPAVQVTALDAADNPAADFTGSITLSISPGTGTVGAVLSGTLTRIPVAGVAVYNNLSINLAGVGYTLTATALGLPAATSAPFDITSGLATRLVFTVQPSNTVAGNAIAPAVQVTAQDAFGNTDVAFVATVVIAIGNNPGGGTLSGSLAQVTVNGVASFANLSIDKAGWGYTLQASAATLTSATSAAFDNLPGPATQLVFTVQPSNTQAGAAIAPAVQVTAQDAFGNTDVNFAEPVRIGIGNNPAAGTLSGSTELKASQGIATFSNLSINKAGSGYTLVANAGSPSEQPTVSRFPFAASAAEIPSATSAAFSIAAGPAVNLIFIVQPSNTAAGFAMAPVQVAAVDAFRNIVPAFVGDITLAIAPGTGTAGATLAGSLTVAAVGGISTFNDLSITLTGTGYQLDPISPGLTGERSVVFEIL
jgi:hypothetical protein